MKLIAIVIFILMFPVHALCGPFLTCDCTPAVDKVTGFQLQFGTQPAIDIPAVECVPAVTDGKRILYDLGTMPQGAFSVKALAKNDWGVSAWTPPLSGTKQLPGSPLPLRITP
jgi:hypothetical protein